MASLRIPALRHLARQPQPAPAHPRFFQRRWARVQDVRFLATHSAQDRIIAKYKDKLENKAKQEGLSDVQELKEVYKEKIQELRKQASVPGATAPLTPPPSPQTSPSSATSPKQAQASSSPWPAPPPPPSPAADAPASPASSTTSTSSSSTSISKPPPGVKVLDSFLDLSKIASLPNEEINVLWRLRHASNPQSLHFSLPGNTFRALLSAAKKHPSFVLPLPRNVPEDGETEGVEGAAQPAAELHYLQFTHPHTATTTLLFTSLAEYKLRGEFASPHTTISFHSELLDSHDLVLGQGIVVDGRGVSVDEARFLLMCMQKFYIVDGEGEGRGELLELFTRGDSGFRVERLLEEAEKLV